MTTPTIKHQVIEENGRPLFVLVPYAEYIADLKKAEEDYIPQEIVEKHILEGKTPIRAWREYKGFTQKGLAKKLDISPSALSQMEKASTLKKSTMGKIAVALEISVSYLDF